VIPEGDSVGLETHMLSQNVPPAGATPLYKACSMRPPPNHTTPPNCRAAPAPHLQVIQAQVVLQHRARRGAQPEVAEPVAPQHVEHVDRRPRALLNTKRRPSNTAARPESRTAERCVAPPLACLSLSAASLAPGPRSPRQQRRSLT